MLNFMALQKVMKRLFSSFQQNPESGIIKRLWTSVYEGVTLVGTFYEAIISKFNFE